mgnify:CR=1 FL=1
MKRKEAKKTINYLCGELYAECLALVNYQNVEKTEIDSVLKNILLMQNDMLSRLSHIEKGKTKLFFKKFHEDIKANTDEIVDQIKALA